MDLKNVLVEEFDLPPYGIAIQDKRLDRDFRMNYHLHSVYEISYVFEGMGTLTIDGETFDLKKGDLFISNDRCIHRVEVNPKNPCGFYVTIFDPEILRGRYPDWAKKLFVPGTPEKLIYPQLEPYTSDILLAIRRILHEQRNRKPGYEMKINSCLFSMIVSLIRMQEHIQSTDQQRSPEEMRKHSALAYIRHNYFKQLSVHDLASLIHVSPRQCSNLFNKWFQCTFVDLLTDVRMEEAKRLLVESEKSVTFIAHEVGYEDISHFIRTFKKRTSYTPAEFRKQYGSIHPNHSQKSNP